ncbi:hypothetical protein JCGZ_22197 [Jatropha curcas]|uniref:T-complex protein 11 n=2 Tax=Jatropha curcas TaxID=180498 RepID=A0A067JSV8_JATCU|nr:hypothetical protein JCGZ_22197 [Jatropha curcas]
MTEPERMAGGGVALNFPANDEETTTSSSLSPPLRAPPRRLRRRLLAEPKTPLTAEDIETKFREADLRRQAKRQRGEYLRQRRNLNSHLYSNSKMIREQEFLSRKLARCWKRFIQLRKTTVSLAKAYVSLDINVESVKSLPFEQIATIIKSAKTIDILKALVGRLESRLRISQATMGSQSSIENIDDLLILVAFPSNKGNSSSTIQKAATTTAPTREEVQAPTKLSRYPVRVVLCAYMIVGHPDAVLNGQGECEISVAESAVNFIREFELLIKITIDGPIQSSKEEVSSGISSRKTFRSQLETFDKAWCNYLRHFVTWKLKDAKLLEEDLLRAACQLEISMMQISNLTLADDGGLAQDMESIKKQILDEQRLLVRKLLHLSGNAGLKRVEYALADARSKFIGEKLPGSSSKSPIPQFSPSSSPGSLKGCPASNSVEISFSAETCQGSSGIVHSLFEVDDPSAGKETSSSSPKSTSDDHWSSNELLPSENELLVNEIIHERCHGFSDSLNAINKDQDSFKEKVKDTMEKAFWDSVTESIKEDDPDFSWVLKLMKEVRDELCEMSPQSWRQEIVETIDVDILSQVLRSGTLDMGYLGKILEFALVTLQKLSASANDEEIKSSHNKLLKELGDMSKARDKSNASVSLLLIKGLRFVLLEIQALKREISKARIRLVKPLIKGPAGLEYLKKAFANRYGPPTAALSSLTLTRQWLSSVYPVADKEWDDYRESLSALGNNVGSSQVLLPTTLRTGGMISVASKIESTASGSDQPECNGEKIDALVRLSLLKLVSQVAGLTLETLPETLKLNLSWLRVVQSQVQKIIVISTSMLILRQMLLTEKLVTNTLEMEDIVSKCSKQMSELLDNVEDVGISEMVATVSSSLKDGGNGLDAEKLQAKEEIIENMLRKSLQAGDPIFIQVSRCVYLALRGAVFGGTGYKGRQLVVAALHRVGAAPLADRVIEAAEVLIVVATVSGSVHADWYEELLKSM